MKNIVTVLICLTFLGVSCSRSTKGISNDGFILIEGGSFVNKNSNLYGKDIEISDFYVSKNEVTQKEWIEIMGTNPSQFRGDSLHLPVDGVNWYDCIEYCNKLSLKKGLKPYYRINKKEKDSLNINVKDTIKWGVHVNRKANGYRLPTEAEWEYAASGGQLSKNYTFSGSNNIDEVAWYWRNCGDKIITTSQWKFDLVKANNGRTKPVATKKPNELGIFDMTGNVREWCEDWYTHDQLPNKLGEKRSKRGGGWVGGLEHNKIHFRDRDAAYYGPPDQGLRLFRNK